MEHNLKQVELLCQEPKPDGSVATLYSEDPPRLLISIIVPENTIGKGLKHCNPKLTLIDDFVIFLCRGP